MALRTSDISEHGGGNCYEAAWDNQVFDDSLLICHGVATGFGPLDGYVYTHAWNEWPESGMCLDTSNGNSLCYPMEFYYELMGIDPSTVHKYDVPHACEEAERTMKYGPWATELQWEYRTAKVANGGGDCFVVAFNNVVDDQDLYLCHGIAVGQGPIDGIRFSHAWNETWDGYVIDQSNGNDVCMPRGQYYAIGHIDPSEVRYYDFDEVMVHAVEYGTYGPWDEIFDHVAKLAYGNPARYEWLKQVVDSETGDKMYYTWLGGGDELYITYDDGWFWSIHSPDGIIEVMESIGYGTPQEALADFNANAVYHQMRAAVRRKAGNMAKKKARRKQADGWQFFKENITPELEYLDHDEIIDMFGAYTDESYVKVEGDMIGVVSHHVSMVDDWFTWDTYAGFMSYGIDCGMCDSLDDGKRLCEESFVNPGFTVGAGRKRADRDPLDKRARKNRQRVATDVQTWGYLVLPFYEERLDWVRSGQAEAELGGDYGWYIDFSGDGTYVSNHQDEIEALRNAGGNFSGTAEEVLALTFATSDLTKSQSFDNMVRSWSRRKKASMFNYVTNFNLKGEVNDFDAAKRYLSEDDMTYYLKNYSDIPQETTDAVDSIEWILKDESSGTIEMSANRELSQSELDEISSWVSGQNSDGIGESFEQQPFASFVDEAEYESYLNDWEWEEPQEYDYDDHDDYEYDYDDWRDREPDMGEFETMCSFDWDTNDYKFRQARRNSRMAKGRKPAHMKRAKYILEDTYGAPQAGVDVKEFDEWWEVEEYLDAHPDVVERIDDMYATIYEAKRASSRAGRRRMASSRRKFARMVARVKPHRRAYRTKTALQIIMEKGLVDFDFWSGAKQTRDMLTWEELEQIEFVLEELYPDGIGETALNDLFWFDGDFIASCLGYEDEEEMWNERNAKRRARMAFLKASRKHIAKNRAKVRRAAYGMFNDEQVESVHEELSDAFYSELGDFTEDLERAENAGVISYWQDSAFEYVDGALGDVLDDGQNAISNAIPSNASSAASDFMDEMRGEIEDGLPTIIADEVYESYMNMYGDGDTISESEIVNDVNALVDEYTYSIALDVNAIVNEVKDNLDGSGVVVASRRSRARKSSRRNATGNASRRRVGASKVRRFRNGR